MSLSPDQIAMRRTGIGASEAAAVLGLSPWQRPIDVFLQKVGLADGPVETPAMKLGTRLESVVLDLYTEETGQVVTRLGATTLRHREHPMILATPDGLVPGGEAVHAEGRYFSDPASHLVEAKTTSHDDGWGEPGTDAVPEHYLVQVAVQMAVTGAERCDVAVLNVLRRDFRVYTVARDRDLEAAILPRLVAFWNEHVVPQEPPTLDGSAGWTEYLRRRFPRHDERMVADDAAELVGTVLAINQMKAGIKAAEIIIAEYENAIRARIGDATGVQGWWGKATWKATAPVRKTDWEAVARHLFESTDGIGEQDWAEAVSAFTTTKEGGRRLLVSPSKRLLETAGEPATQIEGAKP